MLAGISHTDEMQRWVFPQVARVVAAVILPAMRKKTGIKLVTAGANFGEVVTEVDVSASHALLYGGIPGVEGLAGRYPGSFTEEQDSPDRRMATEIYMVDPLDGSGDLAKSVRTDQVISPTVLITKLCRESPNEPFLPVAGMIYHVLGQFALISEGRQVCFATEEEGSVRIMGVRPIRDRQKGQIRYNRRIYYPQSLFDERFTELLYELGIDAVQVPTGGAGLQALQVFRSLVEPVGKLEAFTALEPMNISFNCQPDWKVWDTAPTQAIARALDQTGGNVRLEVDIFGEQLTANAAAVSPKEMWHRAGTVFTASREIESKLVGAALRFRAEIGDLLSISY